MNKKLIIAVAAAMIITGCGDKDDAATGTAEPTMMEQAGDAASDAAEAVRETASDVAEGARRCRL